MTEPKRNYVNGEWVAAESGDTVDVENPADTSEVVNTYPASSAADAEAAIEAADTAQDEWGAMPAPDRGAILRETGAILEERKEELTELLSREEGKTLSEAAPEVQRAIDIFYYYAEKAFDFGGTLKGASGGRTSVSTRKEPIGVAGLITPWNYPVAIPAWKIAPALATGNAVVIKPATQAPGPAHEIARALDEVILPAVAAHRPPGRARRRHEKLDPKPGEGGRQGGGRGGDRICGGRGGSPGVGAGHWQVDQQRPTPRPTADPE